MKYDYDLLVIGGGAAGLTSAGIGANFGAKTLMLEANKLGGDCTWTGCIPSKTLLYASRLAKEVEEAKTFGLETAKSMKFATVMEHVRSKRQEVYHEADRPEIYRDMGVDIEFGTARFIDAHTVAVRRGEETKKFSSRYIIIASGSRAAFPSIPGLDDVPFLTNETIFELTKQPNQLAIIGAGPVGIELAQAFQRLGTQVQVFEMRPRILPGRDEELAGMLLDRLRHEGITFNLSASVKRISEICSGGIQIATECKGNIKRCRFDALLVATGRTPNCRKLEPEHAGIDYTKGGITVDEHCRTNIRHIYAAGDVTGRYCYSHMSEHMAKVAVTNALLKMPMKIDTQHVPGSIFTDPEFAYLGATERQLQEGGSSYEVYRYPYNKIDRALTDGATDGLIKVFAKSTSGKILGAAIYGRHAGELISELALAMRNSVSLRKVADTIHPYPTYSLGIRGTADQWYMTKQFEWVRRIAKKLFGYRGIIPDLIE